MTIVAIIGLFFSKSMCMENSGFIDIIIYSDISLFELKAD